MCFQAQTRAHGFHHCNNGKHYTLVHGHAHSKSFLVCTCAVSGTCWKRIKQSASVQWFKNRNDTHTQTHIARSSEIEEAKSIWVAEPSLSPPPPFFLRFFLFLLFLICPSLAFSDSTFASCTLSLQHKKRETQQRSESKTERVLKWKWARVGIKCAEFASLQGHVHMFGSQAVCCMCSSVGCCVRLSGKVCIYWNVW